jgi:uncharacterized protein DUF6680
MTGDEHANQRVFERRDDSFWDLLHTMSQSLRYPFDRTAIKNGAYIPTLHGDIFRDQELIRTGVAALLNGQRFLKVVAYKPERSLDDMEGFWTLQFTGVQGWGAGVITFMDGQILGGDEGYLYDGTYTRQGNGFVARVHVKQFVAGVPNVMGRTEFDLEMTGTKQGNTITATGAIPGTPLTIAGSLTKQRDLPARA